MKLMTGEQAHGASEVTTMLTRTDPFADIDRLTQRLTSFLRRRPQASAVGSKPRTTALVPPTP